MHSNMFRLSCSCPANFSSSTQNTQLCFISRFCVSFSFDKLQLKKIINVLCWLLLFDSFSISQQLTEDTSYVNLLLSPWLLCFHTTPIDMFHMNNITLSTLTGSRSVGSVPGTGTGPLTQREGTWANNGSIFVIAIVF